MMDVGANTTSSPLEDFLCDKADIAKIPFLGTFELNPTCNMDCEMCYVRMKQEDVNRLGGLRPASFWIDLGKKAMDAGMMFLLLTGGEPLIYPYFKEVFIELQKMGLILTMNTNGTLINEEWAKFFHDFNLRRLNITLYGKDNETYDRLCHNPKGFTQLERAIQLLHQYNVDVRLNCSLTNENYDQLEEMYQIAAKWNCPLEVSYYMFPPNRKIYQVDFEKHRMPPALAAKCAYYIQTHDLDDVGKQIKIQSILADVKEEEDEYKVKKGFICRAATSSFWVNWKGELGACGIMNEPEENIDELGFVEAWEKLKAEVNEIQLSEKCYQCKYLKICPHCAAGEVAEGGFGKAPEYQCQFMDAYIEILKETLK